MVATRRVSSPYTIRQRSDGRYEVRLYTGTDSMVRKHINPYTEEHQRN